MYIFQLGRSNKRLGFTTLTEAAKYFNIPLNTFKSTTLRKKNSAKVPLIKINGEDWTVKEVKNN